LATVTDETAEYKEEIEMGWMDALGGSSERIYKIENQVMVLIDGEFEGAMECAEDMPEGVWEKIEGEYRSLRKWIKNSTPEVIENIILGLGVKTDKIGETITADIEELYAIEFFWGKIIQEVKNKEEIK